MDFRETLMVKPEQKFRLKALDPDFSGNLQSQEAAAPEIERHWQKLTKLQTLLYAERKHAVLIVLQGLDAGGKDGTIRHVFGAFNPQGATVASFKQPTPVELAHDFMWRVHPHVPPKGSIAIFNRSHYEDVTVTRVHQWVTKHEWIARCRQINDFERGLIESGTTILKFFLYISKNEQINRFAQRLADPARNWKISESDYSERALFDDYLAVYEEVLSITSSHAAPWYVVPANHKWFRNLAVSQITACAMEELGMAFPHPCVDLAEIVRKYHSAARAEKKAEKMAAQFDHVVKEVP
ncbi:MAG TPA: polyphosphate kinase 2 family protein [Methylocella sp.]|nr:polyphosphate kinase 2 family protein [Methylocella sp.]